MSHETCFVTYVETIEGMSHVTSRECCVKCEAHPAPQHQMEDNKPKEEPRRRVVWELGARYIPDD